MRHVTGRVHNGAMNISRQIVVFDTADLAAESAFWAGILGGTVEAEDDWHSVYVDGRPRMGFQLAPNHVPPSWPGGAPQQIHLDLYIDDIRSAHSEAMAVGAKLLKAADDLDAPEGFQVYADPSGHPFCLCWG
jgi:catechol 2,3-dioxygenase-like lactoylglutathione lyase family enzyme